MQNKAFSPNKTLNVRGRLLDLTTPNVMGILNVTPDSFYDGGRYTSDSSILRRVEQMIKEGADMIDVGGYSTRPDAENIDLQEETGRVVGAIRLIVKHFPDTVLSVDTFRSAVAKAAVEEGADIINDVSGGTLDAAMFEAVAALQVPYVLMHMRGTPQTMSRLTHYDSILKALIDFFHPKISELRQRGVKDIIIDPGFGFAKTREQNFELLNKLDHLQWMEKPILVGLSRKSMIWKTLDIRPEEALNGTTALHTIALLKGASLLRVHDVKECVEVIKLMNRLSGVRSAGDGN